AGTITGPRSRGDSVVSRFGARAPLATGSRVPSMAPSYDGVTDAPRADPYIRSMKLALAALLFLSSPSVLKPPPEGLTVHEWGTFTSIAGSDGGALEWRPLAGPQDLPTFVHQITHGFDGLRNIPEKAAIAGKVRMETPVLYFYTDHRTEVE